MLIRMPGILIIFLFNHFLSAQVDMIGTQKVVMNINGSYLKIPYFSNFPLDETNYDIKSAIIVIHGTNRNADDYFENMNTAASMRPKETESTAIIAPQFLREDDIEFHSLDEEHLYWSNDGWKSGSNSKDHASHPRPERVPSYAILDSILIRLGQNYPNLESIVIKGHSAGGQVVNRYAATSPVTDILCQQNNVSIKFVIANPSSYLYLDGRRVKDGTTAQFEPPDDSCPGYNDWKYGLDNLYSYPSKIGVDSIRKIYGRRHLVYILGEYDNNPASSSLDVSCEAMLQGNHRLERGSIYFNYLTDYYGDDLLDFHSIDTIIGVGHSNLDMYTSDIGLYHLFESSPLFCKNGTTEIAGFRAKFDCNIYPNPTHGNISIRIGQKTTYSHIRLEVYSIRGERLLVVNNQTEINLMNLTSGIYFLKIEIDKKTKIEKIILIR